MKFILLSLFLALTQTLCAHTLPVFQVEIPYPRHQERYMGSIRTTESELMTKLVSKASEVCGGNDHIGMIEEVEAKFAFSTIKIDSMNFQGSYPLSSVTATIHCQ